MPNTYTHKLYEIFINLRVYRGSTISFNNKCNFMFSFCLNSSYKTKEVYYKSAISDFYQSLFISRIRNERNKKYKIKIRGKRRKPKTKTVSNNCFLWICRAIGIEHANQITLKSVVLLVFFFHSFVLFCLLLLSPRCNSSDRHKSYEILGVARSQPDRGD